MTSSLPAPAQMCSTPRPPPPPPPYLSAEDVLVKDSTSQRENAGLNLSSDVAAGNESLSRFLCVFVQQNLNKQTQPETTNQKQTQT